MYIQSLLLEFIDFNTLNSTNGVNFYLINKNEKMIISNVFSIFSTYENYKNNETYFNGPSEKQRFLNYQFELETDEKIGINLLEKPILNVFLGGLTANIYYLVGQKNNCPGYKLIALTYLFAQG